MKIIKHTTKTIKVADQYSLECSKGHPFTLSTNYYGNNFQYCVTCPVCGEKQSNVNRMINEYFSSIAKDKENE
jgi:hypothetical protein